MGIPDEAQPIVHMKRPSYRQWALVVLAAGGVNALSCIPTIMNVVTLEKVGQSDAGFSKKEASWGQSFIWVGWALGSAFVMPFSDRVGRKGTYFSLLGMGIVATAIATQAHSAALYTAMMFFIGASLYPDITLGYLLMQENLPADFWTLSMIILNATYGLVSIIVAAIGGTIARGMSWRTEMLLWHLPFVAIFIFGPPMVNESATQPKEPAAPAYESTDGALSEGKKRREPGPLWKLAADRVQSTYILASVVCWTATVVGFYGLSFASGQLSADLYTNLALLAMVDLGSYALAGGIIKGCGTKGSQVLAFAGTTVALAFCGWLEKGALRVVAALLGRFLLNIAFTTVYLFLMECFAHDVRGTAAGIANVFARVAGLITPWFASMPVHESCRIMAGLCLCATLATMVLPSGQREEKLPE